jgi:hypothetical protein
MYQMDARLAMVLMAIRLEQARKQSETRRLVRQASTRRPTWRRQLGALLVALGQRLEQRHLTPVFPLEGEALGGR